MSKSTQVGFVHDQLVSEIQNVYAPLLQADVRDIHALVDTYIMYCVL